MGDNYFEASPTEWSLIVRARWLTGNFDREMKEPGYEVGLVTASDYRPGAQTGCECVRKKIFRVESEIN